LISQKEIKNWISKIQNGDRIAVSKAITLVESQKSEDRTVANSLLKGLDFSKTNSLRVGITGPPGVGKSTLIEALGLHLIHQGYRIAVLSIDPSSAITKGSILGDKTRMNKLSAEPGAFIRPSPTGEHLGGVAQRTRESIWLCEAAGYDFILVETAGVGQSEYQVSTMTDITILMCLTGAGDDLQGIKKGIMEWADIIILNKVDDEKDSRALASYKDLITASHFTESRFEGWSRRIIKTSALHNKGIDLLFKEIQSFKSIMYEHQIIQQARTRQLINYYRDLLKIKLLDEVLSHPKVQKFIGETEKNLLRLEISPEEAADISIRFIFALFK
jgi:LAO/AO transport system kinase